MNFDVPSESILLLLFIAAFLVFYGTIRMFLQKEEQQRNFEFTKELKKTSTPIRLQAYERLAMLLERIHPRSLFIRIPASNTVDVFHYKQLLLQSIQQEFEHNISQQIYVSPKLWRKVMNAKNQIILEINNSAKTLPPNLPSPELFKAMQQKLDPEHEEQVEWLAETALTDLQKEVGAQF
jgi:hypothetical protein